jgi:hypothetical protein
VQQLRQLGDIAGNPPRVTTYWLLTSIKLAIVLPSSLFETNAAASMKFMRIAIAAAIAVALTVNVGFAPCSP